jgi:hypothetical protein
MLMVEHDPRLVAQCQVWTLYHIATCRCDACRVVRGEPTERPRIYIEGAGPDGHPDADDIMRRTLTGRVVRWAQTRDLLEARTYGGHLWLVSLCGSPRRVRAKDARAAESSALAATR